MARRDKTFFIDIDALFYLASDGEVFSIDNEHLKSRIKWSAVAVIQLDGTSVVITIHSGAKFHIHFANDGVVQSDDWRRAAVEAEAAYNSLTAQWQKAIQ